MTDDTILNIVDARMRVKLQRPDGKEMEIDVLAESKCGRIVVVEVKKTKSTTGPRVVQDFLEKADAYADRHPQNTILPAFFSVGGFTQEAVKLLEQAGVAFATGIAPDSLIE